MKIMKFGGSSLGSGERMLHVAKIIQNINRKEQVIIIVSAMYSVTDTLIAIFKEYKANQYTQALEHTAILYNKHKQALDELALSSSHYESIKKSLLALFGDLSIYLTLHKEYNVVDYDYIISFGERFASLLVSAALNKVGEQAVPVNASEVIIADMVSSNARALIKETEIQAKSMLLPLLSKQIIPVVTGFFASTKDGVLVTLGRGGSDYSATILANVLDAEEVILWKEIDGVYSADPKTDLEATFYPELSYNDALILAQKGAKVLHPEAMIPVSSKEIPVWVKNTFKPDAQGTKIWKGAV